MKDITVLLELKFNQIQNLKIKLTRGNSRRWPCFFFGSCSVGCLAVDTTVLLFRWLLFLPLTVFPQSFLVDLILSIFSPQSLDGVQLRLPKIPLNSMSYFCCGRSGGPKLMFHSSTAWPSWQPLWWGMISLQNFRSLKIGLYFCVDFLVLSELIGYIDLTDYYEIWPKWSLVINAKKGVRLFDILNTFLFTRSHVTKIAKYSICQLQTRLSREPIGKWKKPDTLL